MGVDFRGRFVRVFDSLFGLFFHHFFIILRGRFGPSFQGIFPTICHHFSNLSLIRLAFLSNLSIFSLRIAHFGSTPPHFWSSWPLIWTPFGPSTHGCICEIVIFDGPIGFGGSRFHRFWTTPNFGIFYWAIFLDFSDFFTFCTLWQGNLSTFSLFSPSEHRFRLYPPWSTPQNRFWDPPFGMDPPLLTDRTPQFDDFDRSDRHFSWSDPFLVMEFLETDSFQESRMPSDYVCRAIAGLVSFYKEYNREKKTRAPPGETGNIRKKPTLVKQISLFSVRFVSFVSVDSCVFLDLILCLMICFLFFVGLGPPPPPWQGGIPPNRSAPLVIERISPHRRTTIYVPKRPRTLTLYVLCLRAWRKPKAFEKGLRRRPGLRLAFLHAAATARRAPQCFKRPLALSTPNQCSGDAPGRVGQDATRGLGAFRLRWARFDEPAEDET